MLIDEIYRTVQGRLNKDQLGYLKPMYYDAFLGNAIRKLYNKTFADLKTNVRKMNWMLDGKDFANYSEHIQQLIEYYSKETSLTAPFLLPKDNEFVADVFNGDTRIEKVHYSDFKDMHGSLYANPSNCSPICSKVGLNLKVSPNTINEIELHYVRKPLMPKWTHIEYQGKPMFDPTKSDFQDVDMPDTFTDALVSLVFEGSAEMLREPDMVQSANLEQQQDFSTANQQ